MKKFCFILLSFVAFITVFATYETVTASTQNNEEEVSVGADELHGGPIKKMFQKHRQRKQMRQQRRHKGDVSESNGCHQCGSY